MLSVGIVKFPIVRIDCLIVQGPIDLPGGPYHPKGMENLRQDLARILHHFTPPGVRHPTPVPGVTSVKFTHTDRSSKRLWCSCLGIMAQGSKEIVLERETYYLDPTCFTATPVALPVVTRISQATPEKPFLALLIDLDPFLLNEASAPLEKEPLAETADPSRAIFTGKTSGEMLEGALRLAKLFQSPQDAAVLGPWIVKEILYWLLRGPEGPAIRQFVRSGSRMHQISKSIHHIGASLDEPIDVSALAKSANMSRSVFFQSFKQATAMSPLQYQKRLRLLEARRLMAEEGETAEGSAYRVGYQSASQFSREYSRMFGSAPVRDVRKRKEMARI